MAESTVVYTPENNGGSVPAWLAMNNGNGLFGNNGWGGGILGFLLGLFFGNGWGGFGGWGNGGFGGNSGAGFLSNQINNDSGRELLMNAINSNGEASRAAVANLSTMLGQDFNLVNSGVSAIRDGIAALTAQTGMSSLQIINAIQAGNSSLASQLCECCCNMRQLTVEQGYQNQIATLNQTNTLGTSISSTGQRTVDAIADLKTTMVQGFCDAKERDMQDKIDSLTASNVYLRSQIDNSNQTAQFAAMLAPISAKLVEIESRQPNTIPVQWPALTAVNTTPYVNGGYYGSSFGFGSGVNF